MATDTIVEIEIDGPRNQACVFRPLQKRLRGRFDLTRIAEPQAMLMREQYPEPIPGQRLRLDTASGKAEIVEPLQLPEYAAIRQRYEFTQDGRRKFQFPAGETFENQHVPTFLYFMKAEVANGTARVIRGKLPETIEGEPRLHFYSKPPENREQKLVEAMQLQTAVLTELLKRLTK